MGHSRLSEACWDWNHGYQHNLPASISQPWNAFSQFPILHLCFMHVCMLLSVPLLPRNVSSIIIISCRLLQLVIYVIISASTENMDCLFIIFIMDCLFQSQPSLEWYLSEKFFDLFDHFTADPSSQCPVTLHFPISCLILLYFCTSDRKWEPSCDWTLPLSTRLISSPSQWDDHKAQSCTLQNDLRPITEYSLSIY